MNKKYIQKNYINLCSPVIGTKIYEYSDQFFGLASRLLKDEPPVFKDGVYDKNGKWMDGWETRRKRVKGNDFVIIKLGLPGMISFAEVDTSFFNGNQPQYASIDACYIDNKSKKTQHKKIMLAEDKVISWNEIKAHVKKLERAIDEEDHGMINEIFSNFINWDV